MGDRILFPSKEDGCVYFYNEESGTWQKICNVSTGELPLSVRQKVREEQDRADHVLRYPL